MSRVEMQHGAVGAHQLTMMDCAKCGEVFAVTYHYNEARRRDGREFMCPNGHSLSYSQTETAEARERRELKARAERLEHELSQQRKMREFSDRVAKGARVSAGIAKATARKILQRVSAGVCPQCQRTFKQLAAHMKCKHGAS